METGGNLRVDVLKLFEDKKLVKVCAPMVRYSKLQFRTLVREYGCDLCYTPMILADSFCKSEKARRNEFTTNLYDSPVITQFAANTVHDFVGAAHMVSPYCDGVDLNCGCPQRWAKQLGLGCCMLEKPEVISDLIKQCRNRMSKAFTISVKTRILKDARRSVEICQQLEKAGVSFLAIHARTPSASSGDINVETLKLIVENVQCPIIANGGVKSLEDCYRLQKETHCKGVMVANSILTKPMVFSENELPPMDCVQKWIDICYNSTLNEEDFENEKKNPSHIIREKPNNLTFQCFHHHLVFMMEKILPRSKRRQFNNLQTFEKVLEFLKCEFGLQPNLYDKETFLKNKNLNVDYSGTDYVYNDLTKMFNEFPIGNNNSDYSYDVNEGSFFKNKVQDANASDDDDLDSDFSNMFLEAD